MNLKKCYLVHLSNRCKINLPHDELVTVGRSIETRVDDIYVSKKQLECVANTESCTVKVKPIGRSICGIDGYAVLKDKTYTLGPGHIVELRLGFHPFEVIFDSIEEKISEHVSKKPKLENVINVQDNTSTFSETGKWEDIDCKEVTVNNVQDNKPTFSKTDKLEDVNCKEVAVKNVPDNNPTSSETDKLEDNVCKKEIVKNVQDNKPTFSETDELEDIDCKEETIKVVQDNKPTCSETDKWEDIDCKEVTVNNVQDNKPTFSEDDKLEDVDCKEVTVTNVPDNKPTFSETDKLEDIDCKEEAIKDVQDNIPTFSETDKLEDIDCKEKTIEDVQDKKPTCSETDKRKDIGCEEVTLKNVQDNKPTFTEIKREDIDSKTLIAKNVKVKKLKCSKIDKDEDINLKEMIVENVQDTKPIFSGIGKWEDIDCKELLIYSPDNISGRKKIAAFDLDGTIIKTKSGARFPRDKDDWVLNYGDISMKLQQLYINNFKLVFFSNQSGIGKDNSKIKNFKIKIENILKKISLPIQVFIALGKTKYRKPVTGMWEVLKTQKNDNVEIDLLESFFVGDAAGREKNWAPKKVKDHSIADRLFAINIGLKFFTPEEYFQKIRPVPYSMPEFDPRELSDHKVPLPVVDYETPNIILMVGGPGSGKSHFCQLFLVAKNYVHINRDTVGSWQKCIKLLEDSLQKKRNCVIDNTNIDREARKKYIDIAKKKKIPCRCYVMTTNFEQCKHNNKFRELTDKSHKPVSDIIINNLKKKYQKPELEEGFDEIIEIPFEPRFTSDEIKKIYKMFLLEK